MTTPSAESFGALLRKYRTAAQLTQAELAERASLSVRGINDLERGARTSPRPETVRLLADALVLQAEARTVFLAAARRGPRGPAREQVLTEQPTTVGTVLPTDPTTAAESAREAGEPVAVHSFLIADVRGYTNYTVEHGDEQAAQLATRFASLARQVVAAHGGRVLEVRGDEALAVFTSSRHALRAAVALQTAFQQATAEDASLPLPVGIGVDAGEAVPVEEGYRGAALNLAARLCALAKAGETLASETVIGLARRVEGLVYEVCEPAVLKGFAEPVRFARVSATLPTADIAAGALREQAPAPDGVTRPAEPRVQTSMSLPAGAFLGALPEGQLVSREAELERINSALDAVTGGAGRLLLLAGEPGVGKTRLAQEAMVAARERGFLIATGRCYEPQMEVPYYPFLETLHHALRQAPTDVWKALAERWPDMVRLLPEEMPGEHGFRLTNLVDARGLGDDRQRLFWQVTRFFQTLAAVQPIALLLDDLHWADEASVDLLAHLTRHTRGDRMLLLGVYRDVEVTRRHPLEGALRDLQRERLVERIAVRRLSAEGTRALIGAVLRVEEVSEAFAGLLHGRAEGNPFFTGELLRDLIERGAVYQDEHGRWERHEIGEIAVPEGVRAVIGQRVGRLAADTQEALVAAAVLGQVFAFDELLDMMGRGEDEVESALEEATGAGLIREESGRDQVGGAYAFVHALIQHTLLGELTARRRRKLHRAAGEVLERLPDRVRAARAAELAWHYIEATEFARALPYTLQAGDQATALYAHAEAERHYRLAAELSTEQGDAAHEAESREKLAAAVLWLDRYDDYRVELERAEVLYRHLDDLEGIRRVVAARSLLEPPTDGLAHVKAQLESIPVPASPGALALCRAASSLSREAGLYADALLYGEQAVGIAREVGDERLQCEVTAVLLSWTRICATVS